MLMHAPFCPSPPKGGSNLRRSPNRGMKFAQRRAHSEGRLRFTAPQNGAINMLHGFSVPLTPQGRSALASPPPWHYSSDCVAIEFWADPGAIAALLPPGVTPDEKSRGRAFFWFLDWQFTGSNDEVTDPARYQYREAFVLVEAVFERTPINYCPYIFVDNDAAIARGWTQGFPKKYG